MADLPFTLDQLRILRAIASEGSFKKAADSLYVTQPAVSLQIQNLEKQLDVSLFDRGGRKAQITEAGHLLLSYCDRILSQCQEACRALDDLHNLRGGSLVVGASQTTGTYLMPRMIGLFRQKYPDVAVQLQVHSTRRTGWSVANGQIDLAIGHTPARPTGAVHLELNGHIRILLAEQTDHPGHQVGAGGLTGADHQGSPPEVVEVVECPAGLLTLAQDSVAVAEEQMAGLGDLGFASPTIEQGHIQLLLEVLNLKADGRLGHIEAVGSFLETSLAGNRSEDAELVEGERQICHGFGWASGKAVRGLLT